MKQIQCNVLDHLKQAQIEQVWLYVRDSQNYTATIHGHWTTNLQIVLNTPRQNSYRLNQAPPPLPQILLPKLNPRNKSFKPKKILRSSLSHIIRSTPPEGILRRRPSE